MAQVAVWSVGHGNRAAAEFIALLEEAGIERLVDVRAYPASRRHPHFGRAALEESLARARIAYAWEGEALGGRRRPSASSPNIALHNTSFRAYADHMASGEFRTAAARLVEVARVERSALMCAERLPWQCHRFLVSDYLVAQGVRVVHLVGPGAAREHRLNKVARYREGVLVYDGTTQLEMGLQDPR
jgi:uncharacterized protein (DUF488 family)